MTVWTTDTLPERERFSYWREVLCEAYVALNPEVVSGASFVGEVKSNSLSSFNVTTISSVAQHIFRGKSEIIANPQEVYFLNLQLKGTSRMSQLGREALIQPGQFAIVDAMEPYLVDYLTDDWQQFSFRIPHSLLLPHLAASDRVMATAVGRDSGVGSLTVDFLSSIANNVEKFSTEGARLGTNLADLVAMSLGPAKGDEQSRRVVVRREMSNAILAYVDSNIADPELSPTKVAAHFRISPRYLHKLLEESQKSFGRAVLERRLERAAMDILASPPHVAISEVAYRWGFNDLSHFSRTFRQRYSCSPSEFRHQNRISAPATNLIIAAN